MSEERLDRLLQAAYREGETAPRSWADRTASAMGAGTKASKRKGLSRRMAVLTVILLLAMPAGVYAGFRLLGAGEAALLMDKAALAEAFERQESEIVTARSSDFAISLLGLVSGELVETYAAETATEKVSDASTYVVVAIQRRDGQPIENYREAEFYISPLIEGLDPKIYNIAAFENSCSKILKDGVLYAVAEWDDFEIFADRKLYVAVIEDALAPLPDSVLYDEKTGQISLNRQYEKASALFEVKTDAGKADPAAAKEKIVQIRKKADDENSKSIDGNIQRAETEGITFMTQNGHMEGGRWRLSLFVSGDSIQSVTVGASRGKLLQPQIISRAEYERLSQEMEEQKVSGGRYPGLGLQATRGLYFLIDPAEAKARIQVDWTRFSKDMWGEEALVVLQEPKEAAGTEFEIVVTKKDGSRVSKTIRCRGLAEDGISVICELK